MRKNLIKFTLWHICEYLWRNVKVESPASTSTNSSSFAFDSVQGYVVFLFCFCFIFLVFTFLFSRVYGLMLLKGLILSTRNVGILHQVYEWFCMPILLWI